MRNYFVMFIIVITCFSVINCSDSNLPPKEFSQKVTAQLDAQTGKVEKDSIYGIEMVYIPAGTIKYEAEYDQHEMIVFLKSFYIGKYEVTQAQWKAVMGNNPSEVKGDNFPVTNVDWYDAEDFVKKLSESSGNFYRLPTQSEWEYAYRAGTISDFYFGNDTLKLGEYEWYDKNSNREINSVGLKKPNPWGLYDMGGNVAEWTAELWDPAPYLRLHPEREPFDDNLRVVRGSSFMHSRLYQFSSSWAHAYEENSPRSYTGFRVIRDIK